MPPAELLYLCYVENTHFPLPPPSFTPPPYHRTNHTTKRAMNNFGVIEVASTRTTHAPGWAYVPDTALGLSAAAALQPTNRKRARNQTHASLSDLSARQEAKLRKELEVLDRDSHRDAQVAIPPKAGGGSRGPSSRRKTPEMAE